MLEGEASSIAIYKQKMHVKGLKKIGSWKLIRLKKSTS
jgi:hypothetical protein